MTRHPRWLRAFVRILVALFDLTEIKPDPCECPTCRRDREKWQSKRRTKGAT